MAAALHTLREWARDSAKREVTEWSFPSPTWRVPDTKLSPTLPDPLTEDLNGSIARWRRLLRTPGCRTEVERFVLSRWKDDDHFDWLASHTVGRQSISRIAKAVGRSRPAVLEAVRGLADLIGFTLPPQAKAARPRKN
jgi:hypothetical protein